MPKIDVIPAMTIDLEKGYYNCAYVIIHLKKEDGVDRKEDQEDMEPDPDEEEM